MWTPSKVDYFDIHQLSPYFNLEILDLEVREIWYLKNCKFNAFTFKLYALTKYRCLRNPINRISWSNYAHTLLFGMGFSKVA